MNEVNALTNMVETKTLEQLVFEIRISGDHSMYGPWEGFDWMQSSKTALTDIEWMQMHSEDAEHGRQVGILEAAGLGHVRFQNN